MYKNPILVLGTSAALFLALNTTDTLAGKKKDGQDDSSEEIMTVPHKKKNINAVSLDVDQLESTRSEFTVPLSTEGNLFDKKNNDFWVIRSYESFKNASKELISEQGKWLGTSSCPIIIKYTGQLRADDLPYLAKWLKLSKLKYFGIADKKKSADFDLIYPWYTDVLENNKNYKTHEIEKLIWLDLESTLHESERGDMAGVSQKWLENHRDYHQENSHHL